jgi:hypothetical protein
MNKTPRNSQAFQNLIDPADMNRMAEIMINPEINLVSDLVKSNFLVITTEFFYPNSILIIASKKGTTIINNISR